MFVVSDFMSEDFMKPLKILKQKHDIILINISDTRELEIPDIGYVQLEDEETGEQFLVNTSDDSFRETYKKLIKKRTYEFKKKLNLFKPNALIEGFFLSLRRFAK